MKGKGFPPTVCPLGTVHTGNFQNSAAYGGAVENLISVDVRPRWHIQGFQPEASKQVRDQLQLEMCSKWSMREVGRVDGKGPWMLSSEFPQSHSPRPAELFQSHLSPAAWCWWCAL